MGFFGKLFGGGGPRKPPTWANAFGDDGARFDAWCVVVAEFLGDKRFPVAPADVRTGSVMIGGDRGGKRREWILHAVAAACAEVEPDAWRAIIAKSFTGGGTPAAFGAGGGGGKPWVIGTSAWGGMLFECGAQEMLMIVLPIVDRAPLAALPPLPKGLVRAIVVCNGGDEGHLDASAIAKASGLDTVYAIDPVKAVDRGHRAEPTRSVKVKPFDVLELGPLRATRDGTCVHGAWTGGTTFLAGDAVPFSAFARLAPRHVVGSMMIDDTGPDGIETAMLAVERFLIVGNVPGVDPRRLARAMAQMGITSELVNLPPEAPETAAEPARQHVIANLLAGDNDRADVLAAEAIDRGEDVADLRHQRAMIALMRGDEAAAVALLAQIDTPQARSSRAGLLARTGDREALALAARVIGELPGDAIAIRGAIYAHLMLDDRDGARAVLVAHGEHLDGLVRAAITRTIDERGPVEKGGHRFPELAALAAEVVKPMVDDKRFAEAEPILRRAAAWDPENTGVIAELGFCLAQQGRDDDAIALYDQAIARGGYGLLLRFNRGNCRLRTQRFAAAVEDFAACVELKADWHEARVSLCSAKFATGDRASAKAEIAELKKRGVTQHVAALEKMLAGTL